jgi:hypothetical protein
MIIININLALIPIFLVIIPISIFIISSPITKYGLIKDEVKNSIYFITNKRIIQTIHYWDPPVIISIELDKIDQIIISYRFSRNVEALLLRGNKNSKEIRKIEFHSNYYKENLGDCCFEYKDGEKKPFYTEINQFDRLNFSFFKKFGICFNYLDDWKTPKNILKEIAFEKF